MVQCNIRTESYDDKTATWEDIQREIQTLDSPQRGDSPRNSAFIVIWFSQNGTGEEFMQCRPVYPKQKGLLKNLLGQKNEAAEVTEYTVEVAKGEKIYAKPVHGKQELAQVLQAYFTTQALPDVSHWEDTGIL